jgi:DnaK suppressor protein
MTARLSATERTRAEARLLAEKMDLERGIRGTWAELDGVRVARADASADDEHDPEGSTLSSDWSRLEGLRRGLAARLGETEDAFARLAAGAYGACSRCGREIGAARLDARPSAALCIDCARELQR